MRALLLVPSFIVALAILACGGGEADLTARDITDEELSLMVLSLMELGPQYADFTPDEDLFGFESNEEAIEGAFNQDDEAEDIEWFGRVNGYQEAYSFEEAAVAEQGPFLVMTGVILFENANGASDNLEDGVEDARRQVGMTSEDVTFEDAEAFEVDDAGDEAAGLFITASVRSGHEVSFYSTLVGFRQGRVFGIVQIARFDDEDVRDEAAALARKLDDRIMAVLRGEVTPTHRPTPTATPTPTAAALSLNEYLVLTLRIDIDGARAMADLFKDFPDPMEEPQAFEEATADMQQLFRELGGDALDTLSRVAPPPEAQAYHTALLDYYRQLQNVSDLDVPDSPLELRRRLVLTALQADADDPLKGYLISATELRLEQPELPDLQELLSSGGTEEDLAAVVEERIGQSEQFEQRWQDLSPPSEAQAVHQRQGELFADATSMLRLFLTGVRDQDEAALIQALETLPAPELIVRVMELEIDWDELTIDALSR